MMEHISTLNAGVYTSMAKRLGVTDNSVPSLTLVVKRFVDGKAADRLDIDVWEYADISKAIDAAKAFIG